MTVLVSTKGRYALRVMIDLASHDREDYIPLKSIAQKQGISEKYLESIIVLLSKAGAIDGLRGKGGGYRLNRDAKSYSVGEILRLTEGSLAPVSCLDGEKNRCERASCCKTRPMWETLDSLICNYLDSISLADFIDVSAENNGNKPFEKS